MAEQKTPCPEMKEGWMGLNDALSELSTLERYVTQCNDLQIETNRNEVDTEILLLLTHGLREKIDYFSRKYGLDVPEEENVETADLIEFVRERCPPFTGEESLKQLHGWTPGSEAEPEQAEGKENQDTHAELFKWAKEELGFNEEQLEILSMWYDIIKADNTPNKRAVEILMRSDYEYVKSKESQAQV